MAELFRDEDFEDDSSVENSEDLSINDDDFHSIIVGPADWTIESLQKQIGNQIDLNPEFQRRGVWSKAAKCSFIESLFLNIPIPQILLASQKEKKNKFIVLDGKQRLLAINEFFDGRFDDGRPFKLKGMRVLSALENKSWADISELDDWPDTIKNHTQRTAVLRGWEKEATLYEIFHRLNSGSVKLSPMELRMALYPGPFLKYAIEKTETVAKIHELLKLKRPDKRMADVELLIRFLAFNDDEIEYAGNLKQFLDDTCVKYNAQLKENDDAGGLDAKYENLTSAISAAMLIFGKDVCRKYKNGEFENRFNRAIFDVIIGSLSNSEMRTAALAERSKFKRCFVDLSRSNLDFVNSVETTTKSIEATSLRFKSWYEKLQGDFDVALRVPRIKDA
ncbi:MAG: DUF262 domain-containing protein [Henriciella sp.]